VALGTSNISLGSVKSEIGESTYSLFDIGTSTLINKWSKYKPIRDAGAGTNWPTGINNLYGLDLPVWDNTSDRFEDDNGDLSDDWDYLHPRGGSPGGTPDEPARLGDFRGYEHDDSLTWPPMYCKTDDQDENTPLSPAQPSGGFSSCTATGKFNVTPSSVRIKVSDLGLSNYYFGVLVKTPDNDYFIKTNSTTIGSSNETVGLGITPSVTLTDPTDPESTYQNLPYGVGSYTMYYCISSTNYTTWTEDPTATIYLMPSGSVTDLTYKNYFTFIVEDWVYTADGSLYWTYDDDAYDDYDEATIYMSEDAEPFTVDLDGNTWLEYDVYASDGTTKITSTPALWSNGCKLRMFPINANGGLVKEGIVYVDGTNCTPYPITVTHQAAPAIVTVYAGDSDVLTVSSTDGHVIGGLNIEFTPHYVPDNDPHYDVCWYIKVNDGAKGEYSSLTTGLACTQDTHENMQSIGYGSLTWSDGDTVDVYLYYEEAPAVP